MRWNNIPRRSLSEAQVLAKSSGRRKVAKSSANGSGSLDPEKIRRLYWDEELSAPTIGQRLDLSSTTIYKIMRQYKIPRRSIVKAMVSARRLGKAISPEGSQSPQWKGGRYRDPYGYVRVKISKDSPYYSMANRKGNVGEHRLIMAEHLGRCLEPWEIVHHINGIKNDNRIKNLLLFESDSKHGRETGKQLEKLIIYTTSLEARIAQLESRITQLEAENILLKASSPYQ